MPKAGDLSLAIAGDGRLGGVELTLKDGQASHSCRGLTLPVEDGGYAAAHGLFLAARIFSLSAGDYAGAGVTEENGISYSYAIFRVPEGTVTVWVQKGLSEPDRITASLNGHSFLFQFVNES